MSPLIKPDGIFPGLGRSDYDAIDRVHFSTLKLMERSPAHYLAAQTGEEREDTDALKLGRAVHVAVFEPERLKSAIAVWDGGTRKGKDWDKFCEQNAGRELLTENEHKLCLALQSAVRSDKWAEPYVSNGRGEVSVCWTHHGGGDGVNRYDLPCKGRIDFDAREALVNLKTTKDARKEEFGRQAWSLRYHTGEAWYGDGYAAATKVRKPSVIVAVEKQPPYCVVVYRIPERHLVLGRDEYRGWMDRLAWCRETSRWPGYAETELELELPRWAVDQDDATGLGLDFSKE